MWVCATAGAGKTTAVSQALPLLERRVAWLTLDDTDAAAGRLVTYLEAALAAEVESAAGVATQALAARLPMSRLPVSWWRPWARCRWCW